MNENFDDIVVEEDEVKEKRPVMNLLSIIFPIASLSIIVLLSIVAGFITIFSGIFFGIMNLIVLGLAVAGGILAYIDTKNFKSFEFILNLATLMVALIVF